MQRFHESSLAAGSSDYYEASVAVYGIGGVDYGQREAKRAWRESMSARGYSFVTDYDLWRERASVVPAQIGFSDGVGVRTLADYEAEIHRIRLSKEADGFTLLHEVGHSLQRAAICRKAQHAQRAGLRRFGEMTDFSKLSRYRYLSCQEELEVRLQDLNRAFAFLCGGRAIANAEDSVRALFVLGMRIDYENTAEAFRLAGYSLTRERFEHLRSLDRKTDPENFALFPDARELIVLRRLARHFEEGRWPELLSKIIFEAPGHF